MRRPTRGVPPSMGTTQVEKAPRQGKQRWRHPVGVDLPRRSLISVELLRLPMVATHTIVRQQEEWAPVAAHVAVMMGEAQRARRL